MLKLKNSLSSILFWSVISAAFIGPGTVTTAASAGSAYGLDLIWVLLISTFACVVLQINVTQITIQTGMTLGELLLAKFKNYKFIPISLGISIVFGCAAYQAGNLLGATLGLNLIFGIEQRWILVAIVVLASAMLWFGSIQVVARSLGSIVALMGVVFVFIAFSLDYSFLQILKSSLNPTLPVNSEILVMGLIGTTIVPYNLFLGSGLSKGKKLSASRLGLVIAISIGGLISIFILLSGTLVSGAFNFEKLSIKIISQLGAWANYLLGIGLFSAGFTSAITAPLAAVFTMKSILPNREKLNSRKSMSYKSIWGIVMAAGLFFGVLDIKPIPAIILAQAMNGIILPFICIFIFILVASYKKRSDFKSMDLNIFLLAIVVYLLVAFGILNVLKIISPPFSHMVLVSFLISLVVFFGIALRISLGKRKMS